MLAYTAWDSLRAIAREYDADLTHDVAGGLVMAQRWERCSDVIRRFTSQIRHSLAAFHAPTACA